MTSAVEDYKLQATSYKLPRSAKRFLVKHVGNMGDHLFFIPPVLATLKKRYPDCHITLVTAWGFKNKQGHWGERNQSGFCIALMMTNPYLDQLIHWHDTELSLEAKLCQEEGQSFPTWNRAYFDKQKKSDDYDEVFELDFGISHTNDPMQRIYEAIGLPNETYSYYQLYFTDHDNQIAATVMKKYQHPRIILLEGIEGTTTRGWDPDKVLLLEQQIEQHYGTKPIWFGGKNIPKYEGQALTLRQNIATLQYADVGIGVMSGPMHFAAAAGLPTITLYGDQPLHRAAPAYFLNEYVTDPAKQHRTILGPDDGQNLFLKYPHTPPSLNPAERRRQRWRTWTSPGRQSTKSCLAVITVDEVMTVLQEMV